MPKKVIVIGDPGIDTAFAIALSLLEPSIEVAALCATAGNVSAQQATVNMLTVLGQLDPPKWPRMGGAPPVSYEIDGRKLHGPDGLGNAKFPSVSLHAPHPSDRLIIELVRKHPGQITIVCLGPMTVLAGALSRDPLIAEQIARIICVGGAWREPGNTTAVSEFHFFIDPVSARAVMHSKVPITLIPLDVTRKLIISPTDLLNLPNPESPTSSFLGKIVPYGIRASSNLYGIEGFHLKDVVGIAALAMPDALTTRSYYVDVETQGELTRGMVVVDGRPNPGGAPNVDLAIGVDDMEVRRYILDTLERSGDTSKS